MTGKAWPSAIDATAFHVRPVRERVQHVDPAPQQPAIAKQEIILRVDADLRRKCARTVTFLQCPEPVILAGRKHFIEDNRDRRHLMIGSEARKSDL